MSNFNSSPEMLRRKIEVLKAAKLPTDEDEKELAALTTALEQEWLIDNWFPAGHKGQITAPEGSFKTSWMSYIAVCVASGMPVFGCRVQQGPVLIIDEETPTNSLDRHLCRFSQGLGYHSHEELPITTLPMAGFRLGRKTALGPLISVIKDLQPRLITLDSLIAILPSGRQGVVENDSSIGEIIRVDLSKILDAAPLSSTLLAAHSKKPVSELSVEELKMSDMQSLVRGHGSIVGEGCDTGYVLKKISEYPEPTRFAIITKPRRQAIPMSGEVVYVEMEEEEYGKGWARLKTISSDVIPPSNYAKAIYKIFTDEKPHGGRELTNKYALYTKSQIRIGLEELINRGVVLNTNQPQQYYLNPRRKSECNEEYMASLENSDKGLL